jgi:hypothetical protein
MVSNSGRVSPLRARYRFSLETPAFSATAPMPWARVTVPIAFAINTSSSGETHRQQHPRLMGFANGSVAVGTLIAEREKAEA